MAHSFVGKPVINEVHRDVSPDNFEDVADGVVTDVKYNSTDGWWWADFVVWDEATKKNCESRAYSVSCAYDVTNASSRKGEHNNIPYEQEVLDGKYTHLAIVANPRYEDARIIFNNSKGGSLDMINLKFWEKGKKDMKNAKEMPLENASVKVGDETIQVKELIDAYRTNKIQNASPAIIEPDTIIEIDGEEKTVQELIDLRNASHKNEKEELSEDEKVKEDEKKKKEMENASVCNDCKEPTKEEALVAFENAKTCVACTNKKLGAKADEGIKHFENLQNKANRRGEPQAIKVTMPQERVEAGRQKYGSIKAA